MTDVQSFADPRPDQPAGLQPWWHDGAWMTDPRLAYQKGLEDGAELAAEQFDRELADALALALSGGATTDRRRAVRIHQRAASQLAARQQADGWAA